MIRLHRINHQALVINALHIITAEATPDTLLTLTNNEKVLVRESPDEVVEAVSTYVRQISAGHVHGALTGGGASDLRREPDEIDHFPLSGRDH